MEFKFKKYNFIGFIINFLVIYFVIFSLIPPLAKYTFKAGIFVFLTNWPGRIFFIIILIWFALSLGVSKAEARANFVKEGGSFIWNGIKNWIRHLGGPIGWALNRIQWRDSRAQYPFHKLRFELNVLMNYLLRLQVYIAKSSFVSEVQKFVVKEIDKKFQYTFSTGQQKSDYIEYMAGYDYKQTKDSTWVKSNRILEFISHSGMLTAKVPGGCGARDRHIVICKYMDMLRERLQSIIKADYTKEHDVTGARETLEGGLASVFKQLEKNYDRAKTSYMRYGLSQYKDSLRWAILDMNNRNGWYRHPYKFASIDARPWIATARIERRNGKIKIKEEIGKERTFERIKTKMGGHFGQQEVFMWEVDNKGRFMDDINKILIEEEDLDGAIGNRKEVRYRKVDPEDIYQGDELKEIASAMASSEWAFFKDDFLTGYLHPESRTWKDYQEAHNRQDWGYRKLKRMTKPKRSAGDAAFDREGLKDPGAFQYRGRKNYYDTNPEELKTVPPINNYPCVSLLGLTSYIIDLVIKTLSEEEQIKFFRLYPQYRHDFETGLGKFGVLGEEEMKKEG